ncbi:DUF362 domain-containing protein [Sutterella seckii]|uniref:DUF362 domain-containing protein n=1 Tax=Sutterella seckii TaxID=1944635 RepID=A0AAI9SCH7_9BURK|nr:DUF362 domain-containing protein [Sutterella seckii]KAB7651108.1 DUF362 domain-containing protein [Sutterella seckii]
MTHEGIFKEGFSITRRRLGQAGAALGLLAAAGRTAAAEATPEVFYSPEVSAEALLRIYDRLSGGLTGKIGIKIHGGEARVNLPLFRALQAHIPGSAFIETNWASDFGGARRYTESHIAEIKSQGVDFAPVDVLDRDDQYEKIPVTGGKELKEIEVPSALLHDYGGTIVLTNFKIPSFAGYTGAIKNIGIGLVSPDAKSIVHGPGYERSEGFYTRLADAAKGVKDRLGDRLISISIITGMHAERIGGATPRSGDLGILGSLDPTAADQAACDLVWGLKPEEARKLSLREKIDSGYLQLECLEGIGSGSRAYRLIRI